MATRRRLLLTGGNGLLGQALVRAARATDLELVSPGRVDYDLTDRSAVKAMVRDVRPDVVIHAAARVGGIHSNVARPYDFLTENILINTHVIEEARLAGVGSLLFFGSSCMYPKDFRSPLVEEDVLAAPLEPTNEGYAIGKIAGAKACEYLSREHGLAYRTLIPCNLYGPGDAFGSERSHLLAAIIAKTMKAVREKQDVIEIWGDGEARREFLFVDDLAGFVLTLLPRLAELPPMLNVGALEDHTVNEYYRVAADVLGYRGRFEHDLDRPVGMRRKLMDSTRALRLGWQPRTALAQGLRLTADNYLEGHS